MNKERLERLEQLANDFEEKKNRVILMEEFGKENTLYTCNDYKNNMIELHIAKDNILVKTYQSNHWVRVDEYDESGNYVSESYEGRW